MSLNSVTGFKFVTSNGLPSEAANDANRRRLVRTQAKGYSLKANASTSQRSSAVPKDISVYTGRLHLNIVPKKANEDAGNGRLIRKYEEKVAILPKQDSDREDADKDFFSVYRPPPEQILSRSLDSGGLDPFDTLSIQTGAQEELLFQHSKFIISNQKQLLTPPSQHRLRASFLRLQCWSQSLQARLHRPSMVPRRTLTHHTPLRPECRPGNFTPMAVPPWRGPATGPVEAAGWVGRA